MILSVNAAEAKQFGLANEAKVKLTVCGHKVTATVCAPAQPIEDTLMPVYVPSGYKVPFGEHCGKSIDLVPDETLLDLLSGGELAAYPRLADAIAKKLGIEPAMAA